MRKLSLLLLLLVPATIVFAQKIDVTNTLKQFHQAMTGKDFNTVTYLHKDLSYGHSNGWVQTKDDFLNDFKRGYLIYHSYKEDSLSVVAEKDIAYARFNADIETTREGVKSMNHLKVLEIWVRENKSWKLFARQAIRLNP